MNNLKQAGGDVVTLTAPSGGVVSGIPVKVGQLFVIPEVTAAATVRFAARVTGVFELVKDAGTAWTEGELVYWDDVAKNVVPEGGDNAGKLLIGVAAADATGGAVLGDVRLNGSARPDGVSDVELDTDAVDTDAIQDLAVTTAKIDTAAVTAGKIGALAVTTAKIDNLAVTTGKLNADAVDGTKIADNAVDSEHIAAGALDYEHQGIGESMIFGEDLGTPTVLTDNRFLLSTVMLATAYVLDQTTLPAGNPPRNVIVTHATDTTTDTLGDAVVDGTDVDDQVIQETITVSADGVATGAKAFKTVTAVTTASWVQAGGVSDTIEVGFGDLLGLSKVRAAAAEVFLGFLAGVARLPDAVAIDAADVEGNTINLTGGTYNGTKTAKALILL